MGKSDYLYLAALCMVFRLMYTDVHSLADIVKSNVGESALLSCGFSNPSWFRNGTELTETAKVKTSGQDLHIFCVELSDNGTYECRDETDMYKQRTYNLVVNNPDNKQFFHIYNKDHNQCLSSLASLESIYLHVENCNLDNCRQKWMWTENKKLLNAPYLNDPKCISADQPAISRRLLGLDDCSSNVSLNWECNGDLLKMKDHDLYLNYENSKHGVILFFKTGVWSRWVKYSTKDNLCTDNRKAVVTPAHVVVSERETVKVICQGINFFNPAYSWLKNGKVVSGSSSLSIHIDSDVMLMPFTYIQSSGNYTCVVKDQWGTATASTVIEIYEDPSVFHHSLNHSALFGKDICLTCQMYAKNTSYAINWYKNSDLISPGDPNFKINNTKSPRLFGKFSTELCINSLDVEDAGKYSCEIMYPTKRASAQGNVQVLVKPKVFIYKLEEDLLLCNASGFPPPRLTWYKNNKHVLQNIDEKSVTVQETGGNFTCVASNSAGTSSDSFVVAFPADRKKSETSVTLIIIGCIIGGILLIILVILIVCCYRRRKKGTMNNNSDGVYHTVRYMATPGQSSSTSEYTTVDAVPPHKSRIEFHPRSTSEPGPKHFSLKAKYQSLNPRAKGEWEVPPDCVKLNKKLGEGQFGQVWKGDILSRKGSRTVAVKMLHDKAPVKDRKALIDELEFMKTMSPHPNIVGLVGCCTRSDNVMIIVEFVPGGNLKDYLLSSRGNSKELYANLAPYSVTLTSKDLLTFAYQIARGMSYLEQIKCVHRDLAARNILVGDDKTCKIADFGLARDIYRENYYRKTNGGRLPLRWMAYESIFNGITTSQSDAWSFGVVLWEIVTLGGNPYPDMNRDQVIDGLQRGYRMPKPGHCADEVYEMMWECWQQNPDKRPTFAELTATFLRLISLQQTFLNMDSFGEDDYVNVGSYEETGEE